MDSFDPVPMLIPFSEAELPTEFGTFLARVYREPGSDVEHVALVYGDVTQKPAVLVRIHSECLTGEVFHSLRCDCGEQLKSAMAKITATESGSGVLIYLRQEGRGIGLGNKIRAYALQQQQGLDTVDANRALGFADDLRQYEVAVAVLQNLAIESVVLMTNNPAKVAALEAGGISVVERLDHCVDPHEGNRDYLATKRERMGHHQPESVRGLIQIPRGSRRAGQGCE